MAPRANRPIYKSDRPTAIPIISGGWFKAVLPANINPKAKSWTTKIPNMTWPLDVDFSFRSIKHLSTTAVEERDSIAPKNTPWTGEDTHPTPTETNVVTKLE